MSKDVMKLALEALEAGEYYIDDLEAIVYAADDLGTHEDRAKMQAAITVLRLEIDALNMASKTVKPDFWEGYVPEPVKPAQCKYPKCSYPCTDLPDCRDAEQPAQQALDKKAENARELGLDYEPAQQEPFGYFRYDLRLDAWVQNRAGLTGTPFYTSPPAQRTWVGLSDAQSTVIWANSQSVDEAIRATEKQLMENNK